MARASDVAAFRAAQRDVAALAYDEILAFWQTLDLSDPVLAVRALEAFLPEVIRDYGDVGAAIAAEFYDDLRAQSPAIRSAYAAVMGDAVPVDAVRASTRWAVGPLFGRGKVRTPEQALANVIQVANRFVLGSGRKTILTNVERDPARARYARVPSGETTCPFCLVLASRGPVYTSGNDAGHKFHGHCDCVPTPMWDGDELPEGYDPTALYGVYKRALRESSTGDLKGPDGVLNTIRRQQADG